MENPPIGPSGLLELEGAARARVQAVLDGAAGIATLESPTELHYLALRWNWDDGMAVLRELVVRPDCALGTAQHVLWHSLPEEVIGFYASAEDAEDGDGEGATFELQQAIVERASAGGYQLLGIGYDPSDVNGTDMTEGWNPATAKHAIPDLLIKAVDGARQDPSIRF
jgi:hypothetical protein